MEAIWINKALFLGVIGGTQNSGKDYDTNQGEPAHNYLPLDDYRIGFARLLLRLICDWPTLILE